MEPPIYIYKYHIISYHIISYHIISYHIISYIYIHTYIHYIITLYNPYNPMFDYCGFSHTFFAARRSCCGSIRASKDSGVSARGRFSAEIGELDSAIGSTIIDDRWFWVNYNELTTSEPSKSELVREIIPKWPWFRLVNYYHLPRWLTMVNS